MPRRHCRDATDTACALLWCALVLRFKDRTMLTGEGAPRCFAVRTATRAGRRWRASTACSLRRRPSPAQFRSATSHPDQTVRAGENVGAGVVPAAAGARAARPRVRGVPVRQKAALPVTKAQRDELARSVQVRWHGGCDGGVPRLDAFLHDGSFARAFGGRAVCLVGDSAMNQFWHALECGCTRPISSRAARCCRRGARTRSATARSRSTRACG